MKDQIDYLLKNDINLPVLSNIALTVFKLCQEKEVDLNKVASEISKDPSLTADVIKLSNSAYYKSGRPIKTVKEGLIILGIKVIKNIVLLTESKKILKVDLKAYSLNAGDNWNNSLMVAEIAKLITFENKLDIDPDLAFTAGLLHNIGKVFLSNFLTKVYQQFLDELKKKPNQISEIEVKFFGYTNEELGAELMKKWNFPEELIDSIRYQKTPSLSPQNSNLVHILHIANIIVLSCGIGVDISGLAYPLNVKSLESLSITEEKLVEYYSKASEIQSLINEMML